VSDAGQRSGGLRAAILRRVSFLAFATVTLLLLSLLGGSLWIFELLTHFRVHYVVALVLCGAAMLALREWRGAAIALAAAAAAAIPTFDYLRPAGVQPPAEPERVLRALSMNVRFRVTDLTAAARYIDASDADIVVMQEVSTSRARELARSLPSYPYAHLDSAGLTDVVVFSRWPIADATTVPLAADGVSALSFSVQWRERPIHVLGVHLHWPLGAQEAARRNSEMAGIAALAQAQREPLLVLGDFNATPWSPHFRNMLASGGLRDCALGHGLQPTWPSQLRWFGIRIDHCLASAHWRTLDVWTGSDVYSDHRPMGVALELTR
jgi:endonuclease/exonuclease/phosphatase (EEP) superfamily protein YafD